MLRFVKRILLPLGCSLGVLSAEAFSLLGPYENWQVERIGYNLPFVVDIGGPMNLGEEYRWNIRTISYGFDPSFVNYFGQRGVDEIKKAIAVLNALPPVSKMSADLSEFPMDTRRMNYEASGLGLLDLKSTALGCLVEEIGLASPERYVWTIRERIVFGGGAVNYFVMKRNFDPVTWQPTSYVNGTLYTYGIFEFPAEWYTVDFADAYELPVDPNAPTFTAVASTIDGLHGGGLFLGQFLSGLTRDDVGALRYLYRQQNYNVEAPIAGTTLSGGVAGTPVDPANTNNTAATALRPGVDKLTFVEAKFDSVLGPFIGITNRFVDYFVTNNTLVKVQVQRVLTNAPDILFSAADLGRLYSIQRTDTSGWNNHNALNSLPLANPLAGPGVISAPVVIVFNKLGTVNINGNQPNAFMFEPNAIIGYTWGAFDGTTNRPFVFPNGGTIDELERQVLGR